MTMHLPIMLFLVPFFIGVSMPMLSAKRKALCHPVALVATMLMVIIAVLNLGVVMRHGSIEYALGGWDAPIGIAWLNDALAAIMGLTISAIAFLSLLYNRVIVARDLASNSAYYTLILVMPSGLVGIVFAADLFNVFVFLEVSALTAYALVGASGGKALVFAFRYLLLGSFGATLYLLGLSHIYVATGSLNMADLALRIPELINSTAVVGGFIYMFLGLSIKMALIPLHSWLPDAYSTAPSSVAPLLASTITKVALVVWVRIEYTMIAPSLEVAHVPVLVLLEEIGVFAALIGGGHWL